jgi:general secretion pathway protein K
MKTERGMALLTAIFVVMLATIAAVAMVDAANFAVHRSANLLQSEAQWWYAEGIEAWVKGILAKSGNNQSRTDGLGDAWAQPVDFLPIDGGAVRGRIEDLQGRFNLNNLGAPLSVAPNGQAPTGAALYMEQFERLLDNLPDFDGSKYHGLSYAIRDWIDADDQRSGTGGAEDSDYLALDPPYRAANQPMKSVSELLMIKGMTPELFAALQPYVTVLPATGTPINVNTAAEPLLLSLSTQIDRSVVDKFVASRKATPLSDISALHGTGEFAFLPASVPATALSVNTHYFELQAQIFIGSGRLALYSVIYRPDSGSPIVLAHSTNTD